MAKRKYKCPNCDNVSVIKENDVRICLSCGFQSLPGYIDGSYTMEMMDKTSPKIVKELRIFDDKLKQYWVPSILDVSKIGMIFPEGNKEEWKWAYAPYVPIPTLERINYKIPGRTDEYYEYRLGLDNIVYFNMFDFKEALTRLGLKEGDLV